MRKAVSFIPFLIISAIAIGFLLMYPYPPTTPIVANDSGYTDALLDVIVDGNNRFTFNLMDELGDRNLFFSPYSIYSAMAIVYEGANGSTLDEISSVFNYPSKEELRPNFAHLYNSINRISNDYDLRSGNALWVQEGFPLLDSYVSNVETYYGAKASNLDFVNDSEGSRRVINDFISAQTNGRIDNLIGRGVLDSSTRLVITNAIYFKGDWKWKFDRSETKEMVFHSPSGDINTSMMYMKPEDAYFNYSEDDLFQAIELPYQGEELSMVVVLPKSDESLNYSEFQSLLESMKEESIAEIYLPKFTFDTKYRLNGALIRMGMVDSFTGSADFSAMTGGRYLYISDIVHQAYICVDEEGTEAAAATAVVMRLTAMPNQIIFKADHPFYFFIIDREYGEILFAGRYVEPQ